MNHQQPQKSTVNHQPSHSYQQTRSSNSEIYHSETLKDAAEVLLKEGIKTLNDAQQHFKEYTKTLIQQTQKNPIGALWVAGGIGFILSSLLIK